MGKVIDLTGQKFSRLTVLHKTEDKSVRSCTNAKWRCICDCGNEVIVRSNHLRSGATKSCGCLQGKVKHGGYLTPEFKVWKDLFQRCMNPKNKHFKDYGERGITICSRWIDNFGNFLADMGPRPGKGYSIDRINNNGNYEPNNCKWSTPKEQANNRRDNIKNRNQ